MNIERDESGGFLFSDVEPPLVELFLAIPSAADPEGNSSALNRLFPDPVGKKEPRFAEEWEEFVKPELRETFENASTTVEADLVPLTAGEDAVRVPREHIDAWLNTLNQARLVLAERFEVTEEEMNRPAPLPSQHERHTAISQMHVYGLLQECLIQGLE